MPDRHIRLNREQLYDLVWSKPMTEIATEFGMSSVAFAKHVAKLDVPKPGRGHWQQVASGENPKREKLPKAKPGTPTDVVITKYERPATKPRRPPRDIPQVETPERIHKFHPVVKELDELLREDVHYQDLLAVRGHGQVVLKVGESTRKRALRFLHVLFSAIERGGHEVRLRKLSEESHWGRGRRTLEVVVDGAAIEVSLKEHLNRKDHEKTEDEKRWTFLGRKYDLEPSGNLILELGVPWGTDTKTRWREKEKVRLENLLGEVVWTVEEAARGLVVHRERLAERARAAEIARGVAEEKEAEQKRKADEERKRQAVEASRAAHRKALQDDLVKMANDWRQADIIMAFLGAIESSVADTVRTPEFNEWFSWAKEHGQTLNPLAKPELLAKPLTTRLPDL